MWWVFVTLAKRIHSKKSDYLCFSQLKFSVSDHYHQSSLMCCKFLKAERQYRSAANYLKT